MSEPDRDFEPPRLFEFRYEIIVWVPATGSDPAKLNAEKLIDARNSGFVPKEQKASRSMYRVWFSGTKWHRFGARRLPIQVPSAELPWPVVSTISQPEGRCFALEAAPSSPCPSVDAV